MNQNSTLFLKTFFSLGHVVPKDCKEQPSKPDQWDFKLNPAREEDKSPQLNGQNCAF